MTSKKTPAQHLSAAADAVRTFNHTSRATDKGWEFPSHTYDALGNLTSLVDMLGQAIEQSAVPVVRTYEDGRVRIDGNGDATEKVAELLAAQEDAVAAAAALSDAVRRMHNATSPMGMDTTGLPGFENDH
jgi:hypothetical protein